MLTSFAEERLNSCNKLLEWLVKECYSLYRLVMQSVWVACYQIAGGCRHWKGVLLLF